MLDDGHRIVLVSCSAGGRPDLLDRKGSAFAAASVGDADALAEAFEGCNAVIHLAGINHECGEQTYQTVHVEGTRNVITAARECGVATVVLSSFLRARPDCGSAYHESKWAAKEIVCDSGLGYTVLKLGIVYGRGDHMLDHVARVLATVPVFGLMGFQERRLRPLAVEDLVDVTVAATTGDRLSEVTVPVLGPEELTLREAIPRIGAAIGREPNCVNADTSSRPS